MFNVKINIATHEVPDTDPLVGNYQDSNCDRIFVLNTFEKMGMNKASLTMKARPTFKVSSAVRDILEQKSM